MNSLSWIIYLIGVVGAISPLAITAFVVPVIGLIIMTIFRISVSADSDVENAPGYQHMLIIHKWFVRVLVVAILLVAFVPSERTMTMIAASEISERLIATEGVQTIGSDAMDLLQLYIKKEKDRLISGTETK